MRILFVCGSMEPGRDGVGDYTRRLATELIGRGHEVRILAFYDKFVSEKSVEIQHDADVEIKVLRLPSKSKQAIRKRMAKEIFQDFNPDWLSLQYVPYAFSSQGIPVGFGEVLKSMSNNANWHFMLHESYLTGTLSIKNWLVRLGQIKAIKSLVKVIQPAIIHTSILDYKTLLANIGIQTNVLGLFGNLPIVAKKISVENKVQTAVYFGAGPKQENFEIFSKGFNDFFKNAEANISLIFCGNSGALGQRFIDYLKKNVEAGRLTIQELGKMESNDLSLLFSKMDFAIARVKPQLLGKSGAAISMLEHGLPLWVPLASNQRVIQEYSDFRTNQCFYDLSALVASKTEFQVQSRLPQITNLFLSSLTNPQQRQIQ